MIYQFSSSQLLFTRFWRVLQERSRKENPQKLTQLSSRSHPRHLMGKRTAQKDTIIDITSDSQVNSNFPYRWSPASLTFNNYFYLFFDVVVLFHLLAIADKIYGNHCAPWSVEILINMHFLENGVLSGESLGDIH